MNKQDIIDYFNHHADAWDSQMIRSDEIINTILDNAGVQKGKTVLDVACGTGVLFPDYLGREIKSITGIDISPKMAQIASEKFKNSGITVVCGDAESFEPEEPFDCIVVYNAFPHFPNPQGLIEKLSSMLAQGGCLTVAHGMSRKAIDSHHSGGAKSVSNGLMSAEDLSKIFEKYLTVTVSISDDTMYQVAGIKK